MLDSLFTINQGSPMTDLSLIKYGFGVFLSVFIIKELLKVVWYLIKKKPETSPEQERGLKEKTRSIINSINNNMSILNNEFKEREKPFWEIHEWVKDLHKWHDKQDKDGVPVWYYRSSLEDAINKLGDNIEKQTNIFSKLVMKIEAKEI